MTLDPEGISRISALSFIRVEYLPASVNNSCARKFLLNPRRVCADARARSREYYASNARVRECSLLLAQHFSRNTTPLGVYGLPRVLFVQFYLNARPREGESCMCVCARVAYSAMTFLSRDFSPTSTCVCQARTAEACAKHREIIIRALTPVSVYIWILIMRARQGGKLEGGVIADKYAHAVNALLIIIVNRRSQACFRAKPPVSPWSPS